ncbi:hypothetical protein RHSIM_Rhsim06G0087100 [Rhododendron simsii]|uniref:J domain-containing protein n=1 Tax=Rhododendron simsii TaxID=118357 RepID=A0A834H1H1_RHOSS|nr:hypothetical protein RHSIM_Rhsim06G0087100 [Rhododendron simsii]
MSNLRTICRPHTVFSSIAWCCCKDGARSRLRSTTAVRVSILYPNTNPRMSSFFDSSELPTQVPWTSRVNQRRTMVKASNWTEAKSPYETLGFALHPDLSLTMQFLKTLYCAELEKNADEEKIKVAYRRLAKFYHPDELLGLIGVEPWNFALNMVQAIELWPLPPLSCAAGRIGPFKYTSMTTNSVHRKAGHVQPIELWPSPPLSCAAVYDGKGTLEEGETAEARFIKIQAAYELLMDKEKRRNYDTDNRVNPMKKMTSVATLAYTSGLLLVLIASQAWMEWLMKKRKAFDQRGDMAVAAWAEQQQREMNLRVRRLSRSKMDPDEERRLLARERKAAVENFNSTIRRHSLVLRKRDLNRKKAEEDKRKVIGQLLAAEGLELASDDDEEV